jgi:hypothetical protein
MTYLSKTVTIKHCRQVLQYTAGPIVRRVVLSCFFFFQIFKFYYRLHGCIVSNELSYQLNASVNEAGSVATYSFLQENISTY